MRMLEHNLDEIKVRCEAATPGPWFRDSEYNIHDPNPVLVGSIRAHDGDGYDELIAEVRYPHQLAKSANIEFIIHAREDVPALVEEVERLRAALGEIANYGAETYTVDGREYSTNMWIGRSPSATKLREIARRVLDEGETK